MYFNTISKVNWMYKKYRESKILTKRKTYKFLLTWATVVHIEHIYNSINTLY